MNAEMLLKKALLQLKRGQNEETSMVLKEIIETEEEDLVSLAQAHSILGEITFIHQNYDAAKEHFGWIDENAEELFEEYDDLLNDEIYGAELLLAIIERHKL